MASWGYGRAPTSRGSIFGENMWARQGRAGRSGASRAQIADRHVDAVRPRHREHRFDGRILIVAAARDRPHGGGVEPAVADVALVDMHADHLAEHHVAVDRPA